ncbi:TadE/TadG family type IV pilus assembly protein [Hyphomicrobium sp.]|uniref:TadE/TadG family type IV pilus assembly protein n=1 Tax=Hyphomicrobium sp. TaxID=82 RepID=UPI003F6EA3DC
MRFLKRFCRDDRGSVVILFSFLMLAVTVLAGIGIDYGRALSARHEMQNALDAAVIAGIKAEASDRDASARRYFAASMTSDQVQKLNVAFVSDTPNSMTGRADGEIKTTLSGLLGMKSIPVTAISEAKASGGGGQVCVLALSKTASQQILVNSGANVDAPECEIHGKSTASPAAIFNAGTAINAKRVCLAGANVINNGGAPSSLVKSCAAAEDPYAGLLPSPVSTACTTSNGNYNGGSVVLTPGVYCGWFNFNSAPTVTFQPGLYIIKGGGWNVNGGTWSGNGVTFYYADQSKIQFNSAVAVTMTAPASGTYANIMMFEAPNLGTSQFIFNDAKAMQMTGLIYLPSRDVTFNSGSTITSRSFTLVINTLILNETKWKLTPYPNGIAAGGGGKSVRLTR